VARRLRLVPLTSVLIATALLAAGCSDETDPLERAGSLGGVVWDLAGESVEGADVRLEYFAEEPAAAAAVTPAAEAARRSGATVAAQAPTRRRLSQNFPNPFVGGATEVRVALEQPATVNLELFDITGKRVRVYLVDSELAAGEYSLTLLNVPSGIYALRLQTRVGSEMEAEVVHGVCCTVGPETGAGATNLHTDAGGEFYFPLAAAACGVRVPITGEDGPQIHGWVTVSNRLRVRVRHDGLTAEKNLILSDMSARHYVELTLRPSESAPEAW
jgi:hypothetical protein